MREQKVFISFDGQIFPSARLCLFWEKIAKKLEMINDDEMHYPMLIPIEPYEWDLDFPEEVYDFFRCNSEYNLRSLFSLDPTPREYMDNTSNWKAARLISFLQGWKAVSDWIWEGIEDA